MLLYESKMFGSFLKKKKNRKKKRDVRKFMGDGILTCFYEFKDYCSEIRPIKRTTI